MPANLRSRFHALIGLVAFLALIAFMAAGCGASGRSAAGPAPAPRWSEPAAIAGVRSLTAISCPLRSFCVAVGGGQGVTYTARGWSRPATIDRYASSRVQLTTVSCTSSRFCVAGDSAGHAFRFDGSSWSGPTPIDTTGLLDVSCASPGFCGAVDDSGEVLLWHGVRWSRPASITDEPQLVSIACPAANWCMAVDGAGTGAYELDSGRWRTAGSLATSTPVGGSEPDTLSTVGCSSATACAALDDFGEAFTWAHGRWSAPFRFDPNLLDQSGWLSCPSASFCMVVDPAGDESVWVAGRWSQRRAVTDDGASLADVACAQHRFCIAVDSRGRALNYRSP